MDTERLNALLRLEDAGELPPDHQAALNRLREEGEAPPPLRDAGAEPASMTKEAVPRTTSHIGENIQDIAMKLGAGPNVSAGLATALTLPQTVGEKILPSVLPTAGSIAGFALGGPAGEAGGSLIGTAANMGLGLEPFDKTQLAISAAAPPTVRGLTAISKAMVGGVAKSMAGRASVAAAAGDLFKKVLGPSEPSAVLFERMRAAKSVVPTAKISAAIDDALSAEAQQAKTVVRQEIESHLAPLKEFANSGAIPSEAIEREINRIGRLAGDAFNSGSNDLGRALSSVRNSMLNALDDVGIPEAKAAMKAFRREQGIKSIAHMVTGTKPLSVFRDALANDPLLAGTFPTKAERDQIERILAKVSTATWSGFAGVMGRIAVGLGIGDVAGATAGVIGAAALPELVANLTATSAGRKFLEMTLRDPKAVINAGNFMAAGTSFLRAQMAQSEEVKQTVRSALRDMNVPIEDKLEISQGLGQRR